MSLSTVDVTVAGSSEDSDIPACVKTYASHLKQYYINQSDIDDGDSWPPRVAVGDTEIKLIKYNKEKLFSNTMSAKQAKQLRFGDVDKIVEEKVEIEYENMFCHPDSIGKKLTVLIDGAPGVGKTTLCSRIATDWANGTIQDLNRFNLVMLVPLRRISEATEVDELFHMYTDHKKTREEVIDVVTGNTGLGIMLLLDGFDELTPELRNKSLFVDLINGRRLTNCTVFVTSRPYASQKLQRICNRRIEILGFSRDKIRCCINSAFSEDKDRANDLIRDLESRGDLFSLCYIPMNCAIIIFVYKGENCHLPSTVTALYELYLTHALRRHASKIGLQEDFVNLKDLPNELEYKFGALAEIAYKFLIEDKFVFSLSDLGTNREARTQLQIMGLVTSFSVSSGSGLTQHFQFLHLTIQEFLAAWHASQLSPEEQATIICDFSNSRLKLMHYFLAGLTKLRGQNVREAFNQSFKDALTPDAPGKKCDGDAVLDQLHMIYEAQSPEICQQVSRNFPEETILFKEYRVCTVFLCKVVSFFLSNSSCAWKKVSLYGLDISNRACLQAFHVTGCCSSIQKLVLCKMSFMVSGLPLDSSSLIPNIPLFQKVESLSVRLSSPTPDQDKFSVLSSLANLFQMQHLKKLSYYEGFKYSMLPPAAQAPLSVPFSSSPKLLQAPPAAQTLSVPNTLQRLRLCLHHCDLKVMELLGSGFEVSEIKDFGFKVVVRRGNENVSDRKVGLEMIATVLPYITKMKHLEYLSLSVHLGPVDKHAQDPEPTASDDRLKCLHTMLKSTKTLKKLKINIPDMIPYCVDYICNGLKSNSTLSELVITSNHSCDLFSILSILDSLSIHRIENISLGFFASNELMKIWNVILDRNILSEFQEISVSEIFRQDNSETLKVIKNSNSTNVNIEWSYVDSSDAFEILNSLKDRCQNIKNFKLTFKGVLVSTHTTENKEHLLTEQQHVTQQQDTTQCKIGEMLAFFLLNCECTFDFSSTHYPYDHPQPLYLDHQLSFVAPYLSHGMSDFPQDSFFIHNKIIYIKYGHEHSNYFHLISDLLHRNQDRRIEFKIDRSRCSMCTDIMMTHCFELHLQPVSELPPQLQCLSPTLSSLQQIVSTQKCVGKITAHAKKCTPIIEKLEYVCMSEEDHDCCIYIAVDIRIMGSDHVTVQSQLKWIVNAVKIKCPYFKHVQTFWKLDKEDRKILYPKYFREDEEDLGDVISDIPFLKPQHQNTSPS